MVTYDPDSQRERIARLVQEAGSQAAFIREVWGNTSATNHRGKVNKWVKGRRVGASRGKKPSGLSVFEAVQVAEAFGRNPAWLLLGPPHPERLGIQRTYGKLTDEVRAFIASEIDRRAKDHPLRARMFALVARGDVLLDESVEREWQRVRAWVEQDTQVKDIAHATLRVVRALGHAVPESRAFAAQVCERLPARLTGAQALTTLRTWARDVNESRQATEVVATRRKPSRRRK